MEDFKKHFFNGLRSFKDPENGYSVQYDYEQVINDLYCEGIREEEIMAYIQGFHDAVDLIKDKKISR